VTPSASRAEDQLLDRAAYDHLVERGDFGDRRVELLWGELVEMSPQGPLHSEVVHRLLERLMGQVTGKARIRVQAPLAASESSEPEPDLALVAPGDYADGHPAAAYLIIEVAATSLPVDRDIKSAIYAACGVPEYWIVNLVERTVEVHTAPEQAAYREKSTKRRGDVLQPRAFPGIQLAVADIL
jgi:Uma2 family endonuclease